MCGGVLACLDEHKQVGRRLDDVMCHGWHCHGLSRQDARWGRNGGDAAEIGPVARARGDEALRGRTSAMVSNGRPWNAMACIAVLGVGVCGRVG